MSPEEWKEFDDFSAAECGEGMNLFFMRKVVKLRAFLGLPMIVTAGWAIDGHAENSYHYQGRALDFWVDADPRFVMRKIDIIGEFNGVGYYPWSKHRFFHIDDRNQNKYQRWVSKTPGQYVYLLDRGV
jgi:hypothetical protein